MTKKTTGQGLERSKSNYLAATEKTPEKYKEKTTKESDK